MDLLTINKNTEGSKMTAEIIGRIDVMTAPQFENEVTLALDGVTDLVLDLKQLDYMSSAGLRVVVGLQKTMTAKKGTLLVRSPSERILDIFTATGLADFLDIEK